VEACVRFPYESDRKSYLNEKVSLLYTAWIFDPWTWAVWAYMSSLASQ